MMRAHRRARLLLLLLLLVVLYRLLRWYRERFSSKRLLGPPAATQEISARDDTSRLQVAEPTDAVAAVASANAIRLQVSITRLKVRNLSPSSDEGALNALKNLFWSASPPAALRLSLRWGNRPIMCTGLLDYPQPGETPVWPDRFTFEHVTAASSISSERLELCVRGLAAKEMSAPERSGAPDGSSAGRVIGHIALPLEALASGPTRNDHPLRGPPTSGAVQAGAAVASDADGSGDGGDGCDGGDSGDGEVPTGARVAFRCRVSELRQWRLQLDNVRVRVRPEMLEPSMSADNTSRAFLFSLSYIFTSGSTDQSSREREWHASSSQLRVSQPGAEVDLAWEATPPLPGTPPAAPPTSLDGSEYGEGSCEDSPLVTPRESPQGSCRSSANPSPRASPRPPPRAKLGTPQRAARVATSRGSAVAHTAATAAAAVAAVEHSATASAANAAVAVDVAAQLASNGSTGVTLLPGRDTLPPPALPPSLTPTPPRHPPVDGATALTLPTITHTGAFWEVRHGALRVQLSWKSFSCATTTGARKWGRRAQMSYGAAGLAAAPAAAAAMGPASPAAPTRHLSEGGIAQPAQEAPPSPLPSPLPPMTMSRAPPHVETNDENAPTGLAREGVAASGDTSGAAKAWLVMEKTMDQLPNHGHAPPAGTTDDSGASSIGGAAYPPAYSGADVTADVPFCEELYAHGRVVGEVSGVLRVLDLPQLEQVHYGTLTESGIAFTGPAVVGVYAGMHIGGGESGRDEARADGPRDGAARLGPLLSTMSRALRRGDEGARQAAALDLGAVLASSHKESLVCFIFRDVAALHACRSLLLDVWEELLSGLESRSLGFAARSDCYGLIRLLLARAEIGCTLHDAGSGGVGQTPLTHLIRWRVLVQRTLAWVLLVVGEPPAGGDGPALRDFCAAVMASAYFRLPQFGYALLAALQSEDVLGIEMPEFRGITFTLDCADELPMFAQNGFAEHPPLDWRALHARVMTAVDRATAPTDAAQDSPASQPTSPRGPMRAPLPPTREEGRDQPARRAAPNVVEAGSVGSHLDSLSHREETRDGVCNDSTNSLDGVSRTSLYGQSGSEATDLGSLLSSVKRAAGFGVGVGGGGARRGGRGGRRRSASGDVLTADAATPEQVAALRASDELLSRAMQQSAWRQRLRKRGHMFCRVYWEWLQEVCNSLDPATPPHYVQWHRLPGYKTMFIGLLLEMRDKPIVMYTHARRSSPSPLVPLNPTPPLARGSLSHVYILPPLATRGRYSEPLIQLSNQLLRVTHLHSLLTKIVFQKASVHDVCAVSTTLNLLGSWMTSLAQVLHLSPCLPISPRISPSHDRR